MRVLEATGIYEVSATGSIQDREQNDARKTNQCFLSLLLLLLLLVHPSFERHDSFRCKEFVVVSRVKEGKKIVKRTVALSVLDPTFVASLSRFKF